MELDILSKFKKDMTKHFKLTTEHKLFKDDKDNSYLNYE